ncbi:hypothetical protein HK099_002278 [Clydaea vesicula]|uniref:Uncharacterized protein n=1 Tax=Clydaea vesicula TaxID=447962 RepID=A0AAD5XWS7_9FUNG|nr:hypothetical protein HK099_002278 [Clydaea vesicula]
MNALAESESTLHYKKCFFLKKEGFISIDIRHQVFSWNTCYNYEKLVEVSIQNIIGCEYDLELCELKLLCDENYGKNKKIHVFKLSSNNELKDLIIKLNELHTGFNCMESFKGNLEKPRHNLKNKIALLRKNNKVNVFLPESTKIQATPDVSKRYFNTSCLKGTQNVFLQKGKDIFDGNNINCIDKGLDVERSLDDKNSMTNFETSPKTTLTDGLPDIMKNVLKLDNTPPNRAASTDYLNISFQKREALFYSELKENEQNTINISVNSESYFEEMVNKLMNLNSELIFETCWVIKDENSNQTFDAVDVRRNKTKHYLSLFIMAFISREFIAEKDGIGLLPKSINDDTLYTRFRSFYVALLKTISLDIFLPSNISDSFYKVFLGITLCLSDFENSIPVIFKQYLEQFENSTNPLVKLTSALTKDLIFSRTGMKSVFYMSSTSGEYSNFLKKINSLYTFEEFKANFTSRIEVFHCDILDNLTLPCTEIERKDLLHTESSYKTFRTFVHNLSVPDLQDFWFKATNELTYNKNVRFLFKCNQESNIFNVHCQIQEQIICWNLNYPENIKVYFISCPYFENRQKLISSINLWRRSKM